jgi:hypothetical protein
MPKRQVVAQHNAPRTSALVLVGLGRWRLTARLLPDAPVDTY